MFMKFRRFYAPLGCQRTKYSILTYSILILSFKGVINSSFMSRGAKTMNAVLGPEPCRYIFRIMPCKHNYWRNNYKRKPFYRRTNQSRSVKSDFEHHSDKPLQNQLRVDHGTSVAARNTRRQHDVRGLFERRKRHLRSKSHVFC